MTDRLNWDELWATPTPSTPTADVTPIETGRAGRYAISALDDEAQQVAQAAEGTRNDVLNRAAFRMGRLVGSGLIDQATVRRSLEAAGRACGLDQDEIDLVLRDRDNSALSQGQAHPRQPQPLHVVPEVTVLIAPTDETTVDEGLGRASWAPVELEAHLTGTYEPEVASLMPRTDGHHLLYPGRTHSFHGESESGKSLIAQAETARLVIAGQDCLYIDFESDAAAVVGRLIELGAGIDQLRDHFTYIRPDVDPRRFPHEREALAEVLGRRYALVIIDGVTDALGVFGFSTKDNDDIASFNRVFARAIAAHTGAAVVMIDHVSKNTETRGRFAIGGQAKMAALDGAAYLVEVVEALGQGLRGVITLRVGKDRPGGVRAHAGAFRALDRTQEAARIIVDSTDDPHAIDVTIEAPTLVDGGVEFRPTHVMEKVSHFLEAAPDGVSKKRIEDGVGGRANVVRQALAILVRDGFVREEKGPRNAMLHISERPFRDILAPEATVLDTTSSHLVPPRPDIVPDEVIVTSSQPPLRGLDGTRSRPPGRPSTSSHPNNDPLVSCDQCFTPVSKATSEITNGLCKRCFNEIDK